MDNKVPKIETERLLLRLPIAEDFEPWAAYMADEESARHIGGQQPRAVAWRGFLSMVGRLGPWVPEGWPGTEVGWGIVRDVWGRGYAVEGAAAAIDWAFDTLGWSEVIHTIDPANLASLRVAIKLGSRNLRPGRLPPPYEKTTIDVWGQSREEWRANRLRKTA
jgi:RimJ/RimL family protein N-acetyltransferase